MTPEDEERKRRAQEGPAVTIGEPTPELYHSRAAQRANAPSRLDPAAQREQASTQLMGALPPPPAPAVGPPIKIPDTGPLTARQAAEARANATADAIAQHDRMTNRALALYDSGVSPGMAVEAAKAARYLGLPRELALGDPEMLRDAFKEKRFGELLPDTPVLRRDMSRFPDMAARMRTEDVEQLSHFEKVMRGLPNPLASPLVTAFTDDGFSMRRFTGNYLYDALAGPIQTAGNYIEGPARNAKMLGFLQQTWLRTLGMDRVADAFMAAAPVANVPVDFMARGGQGGKYIAEQLRTPVEERNWLNDVAEAFGQIAGQVAIFRGMGLAGIGTMSYFQGFDIVMDMIEADEVGSQADPIDKYRAAVASGLFTAVSQPPATRATASAFSRRGEGLAAHAKDLIRNAFLPEFIQEGSQNLVYDLAQQTFTNPEVELSLREALYEGSVGGTAAALFRAVLGVRERGARVGTAVEDGMKLKQLMDLARKIEFRAADPESFADLAQRMAEAAPEGEAVTHAYVDANTLVGIFEEAGIGAGEVVSMFPSVRDALPLALESDTALAIPIGELLANAPGSQVEQLLLPHLRLAEDGLSPAEANDAAEALRTEFTNVFLDAIEGLTDAATWEAQGDTIFLDMVNQLTDTGVYSAEQVGAFAAMVRAFHTSQAQRMGITPLEHRARFPGRGRSDGLRVIATTPAQSVPGPTPVEIPGMLPGMAEVAADLLPQDAINNVVQIIESLPPMPKTVLTPEQQATVGRVTPEATTMAEQAGPVKARFDSMMETLTQGIEGAWYLPGPIKSAARIAQKAATDYDGDVGRVLDVVRATIVAPTVDAVMETVRQIEGQVNVIRLKNRIDTPAPGGMRDILMNVQMEDGSMAEIQVHVPEMLAAKEYGRALYERARVLPDGDPQLETIKQAQAELYGKAWEKAQAPEGRDLASAAFSRLASSANASGVVLDPMEFQRTRSAGAPVSARTSEPSAPSSTGTPSTSQRVAPDGTVISDSDIGSTSGDSVLNQRPKVDKAAAVRHLFKAMTPQEIAKVTKATASKILAGLKAFPSINEMAAIGWAGRAKRGWYAQSAQALSEVFGPDAPRFAALLAATSPQTSVESNLLNALNIWKNWTAAGRPVDAAAVADIMADSVQRTPLESRSVKNLQEIAERFKLDQSGKKADLIARIEALPEDQLRMVSVLPAWIPNTIRSLGAEDVHGLVISGPKVNSFFRNLVGVTEAVTLDTWMGNYALVEQALFSGGLNEAGTDPGLAPGYVSMSVRVRQAAARLTKLTGEPWTPAEVQETIWSWTKALHELQRSKSETRDAVQLLEDGALTDALINSVPDFSGLFNDPTYSQILEDAGYGNQLEQLRRAGADQLPGTDADQAGRAAPETAPFTSEAQRKYERAAAQRLARLYGQEKGGKKVVRTRKQIMRSLDAEPEPQFAREPADQVDGYLAQRPLEQGPITAPATLDDFSPGKIKDLLSKDGWAIFTAENPNAQELTPEENAARQAELKADLDNLGVEYIENAIGQYESRENPFVIVNITQDQAIELGAKYGQESVLTSKGLIYGDRTVRKARGIEILTERPDDYYTEIPQTGVIFRVDIDFENPPVPLEPAGATQAPAGRAEPGAPTVGFHFSRQPRTALDGRFYGKGMRGAEGKWVKYARDGRVKERVYVYLDEGQGVFPESGVGYVGHTVPLENFKLYDAQKDPNRFWDIRDPEDREVALLDAGYDGYFVTGAFGRQGAAVILGEASHEVAVQEGGVPGQDPVVHQPGARGTFSPSRVEIALGPNSDSSTFLHEMGHFFLEAMSEMAASPDAPAQVKQDMQTILDWFGIEDVQTWRRMSLDQQRPYHEKFAESFEQYVFEGKAPSAELRGAFRRFRHWLTEVYQSLQQFMTNSDADLNPEIREVMSRLLATDQEINQALERVDSDQLYQGPKPDDMTDAEWADYNTLAEDAVETAVEELQTRTLRDMQWMDNARGRELKKLQAKHKELRKAVEEQVREEVRQDPVYAVWRWLRTGELPDGTKTEGARLSTQDLREMYGDEPNAAWRWLPTNILAGKDSERGMHPDMAAEMFGFDSGDAMVRSLLHAAPEGQQIEAITDQRMLQEHGDVGTPQAMKAAADKAVHNEARARMVASEIKALRKAMGVRARTVSGGSINVLMHAARQYAKQLIAQRGIAGLGPGRYQRAEVKAAGEAEAAMARGDTRAAAQAKRNQLLNHYLAKEAIEAKEQVDRDLRHMRKFEKEGTRKNLDPEYLEQIDSLLAKFDLRRGTSMRQVQRRQSLVAWVESQREMGLDPAVDAALLEEAQLTSYKQMSVEQFNQLVDSIKSIEHLGRLKNRLLKAQDRRQFNEIITELVGNIKDKARRVIEEPVDVEGPIDRTLGAIGEFIAMHRKLSSLARQMDGDVDGGPMWQLLVRPLNAAMEQELNMRHDATRALMSLLKPFHGRRGAMLRKVFIPEINRSLSKEARITTVLNMGNETNMQRLMDENGDNWTREQLEAIARTLTTQELQTVQKVWDFIDSYWGEISAKQQRVTGVTPEKVEAVPLTLVSKDGTSVELKGGYYPIKYDVRRSSRTAALEADAIAQQMRQGFFTRASTRRGHVESRQATVGRPLRKDMGVLFEHVGQVIHDLALHEYLVDANRILSDKRVDAAVRKHHGEKSLKAMKDTVKDVAVGDIPAINAWEGFLNHIRAGVSIAGMGWNLMTASVQVIGLTQSVQRIGAGWVFRGMASWVGDATKMESTLATIQEKSSFMRDRGRVLNREVAEVRNRLTGKGPVQQAIEASYFWLLLRVQFAADIPTWQGMYLKMQAQGMDEATSVALADQAVRDTQGSGLLGDMSAIQRGSPMMKLWTNFYNFFNTTFNLMAESVARTDFKNPMQVGKMAGDIFMLTVLPAFLSSILYQVASGALDLEDPDMDKFAEQAIKDQISYMMGMMVGVRDLSGIVTGFDYAGPAGLRFYSAFERAGRQWAQGEVDQAAVKATINVSGILFHFPSTQVNRVWEGSLAVIEEDAPMKSILYGPPRN